MYEPGLIQAQKDASDSDDHLPVITFDHAITFHWNGQAISVWHPNNAHTDGDAFIYFKGDDILHMGDIFFNGGYPFVDLNSGGDLDGYIAAQDSILAKITDQTRIIPGHGPLANKEDLQNTVNYAERSTSPHCKIKSRRPLRR